jgi:hypothetical protein
MATCAEFRRAFEDAPDVTGFAIHFKVPATEGKAGVKMIKIGILDRMSCHW